jgi:hypothetical protein
MSPSSPLSADVRDLLHDRLDTLLAESETTMNNAAYGQAVHDLDDFLFVEGRKFLHEVYQQKLQERINQTEASAESHPCPQCKKKRTTKTKNRKV